MGVRGPISHWVATNIAYVSDATDTPYYPGMNDNVKACTYLHFYAVLVDHNGYAFDFPILLAEVERRPTQLAIANMEARNVHLCDTLP